MTKPGARWIQIDPDRMKTSALEIAGSFSRRQDMALLQAAAAAMEVGGYFGDKMLGKQHGLDKPNVNCIVSPMCSGY